MYVPFSQLSKNSRVWIYQSDQNISENNKKIIDNQLTHLCNNWNAHGAEIHSSFIIDDFFIYLFADESIEMASGCSIDNTVKVIKSLSDQLNIDFFNRLNVVYIQENKAEIISLNKFKSIIKPTTLVYNNMIRTKDEFENNQIVQVKDSWLSRFV